jgi:hypothetical protein
MTSVALARWCARKKVLDEVRLLRIRLRIPLAHAAPATPDNNDTVPDKPSKQTASSQDRLVPSSPTTSIPTGYATSAFRVPSAAALRTECVTPCHAIARRLGVDLHPSLEGNIGESLTAIRGFAGNDAVQREAQVGVRHNRFPSTTGGWEVPIGRLFWAAGRNPIAHVRQAKPFTATASTMVSPANVMLDVGTWSEAVTAEWHKNHPYRALAILPPLDLRQGEVQMVTFFHQMLFDELLPVLAEGIAREIEAEGDEANLSKIVKLNRTIPH